MAEQIKFIVSIEGTSTPYKYVAWALDGEDSRRCENMFEWREPLVSLELILRDIADAAISAGHQVNEPHIQFGRQLYSAVFSGQLGDIWASKISALGRNLLNLVIRINPTNAHDLLRLPWEYLHDGEQFLALSSSISITHIPWGVNFNKADQLTEALRMLVIISAPMDLPSDQSMNVSLEENQILESTKEARYSGKLELEFTTSASLNAVKTYLRDFDPHIIYFVGHGYFDDINEQGGLVLETTNGKK